MGAQVGKTEQECRAAHLFVLKSALETFSTDGKDAEPVEIS